jgi:hypothetical protein
MGMSAAAIAGDTSTIREPAARGILLVGANPCVTLFDGATPTTFVSVWRVDWSPKGSGTAAIVWMDGAVRVYGANRALGAWLERTIVRWTPEALALDWSEPRFVETDVTVTIDLASGMSAQSPGLAVLLRSPLDLRPFETDDFQLGSRQHSLRLALAPMRNAVVRVDGHTRGGRVDVAGPASRPTSSAFVADAEVWRV